MRTNWIAWVLALVAAQGWASGKETSKSDCPMHQQHMASQKGDPSEEAEHFAGVRERSDQGMGFSHKKTIHHFGLTRQGGFISAESVDANDIASQDSIRRHFEAITKAFSSGDFNLPMLIHGKTPPGVRTMKRLRSLIKYEVEETERGARVVIFTQDTKARSAIHKFLRFQIEDHQTGDALAVGIQ